MWVTVMGIRSAPCAKLSRELGRVGRSSWGPSQGRVAFCSTSRKASRRACWEMSRT